VTLDTDTRLHRRRLKRHLTAWRAIAILALAGGGLLLLGDVGSLVAERHIARLSVSGVIVEDAAREEALRAILADAKTAALIVRIDSPGGTVVGGESLYTDLRAIAERIPVVAVMGTMATSGGYMTALGADHIVAREGSLTGSIGVIFQDTDISGLLEILGVGMETIKSVPLKGEPSPLTPLSPEAREATRLVVLDLYAMFVDMVAERRGMERVEAEALADGRVFTGRQALANGLIDELGGETDAIMWLEAVRGVAIGLPAYDVEIAGGDPLWRLLASTLAEKTFLSERLTLDGTISLWQP
jgi:protease-4